MSETTRYTPPFEERSTETRYTDAEVQQIMDEIRVNYPGITKFDLEQLTLTRVREAQVRYEAANLAIDFVMPKTPNPDLSEQNRQIRKNVAELFTTSDQYVKDAVRQLWPAYTAELENQQK